LIFKVKNVYCGTANQTQWIPFLNDSYVATSRWELRYTYTQLDTI
jgi:hypothetical protein